MPSSKGTIRIFQEGAQRIIGFEFRASLMMDMIENNMESMSTNGFLGPSVEKKRSLGSFIC